MSKCRVYVWFVPMLLCSIVGCVPYKSLVNFDETPIPREPKKITNYTPLTIQVNDILSIGINSLEAEVVEVFNESDALGYLVANNGTIDFPLIGEVELQGMTIEEAKEKMLEKLSKYFVKNPGISMAISNFKILVNGEVRSPGTFNVSNERLSVMDAITLAGDFTPYSRRDSILIIREVNGIRSFGYVNFNRIDILESPYFYLRQNDVIYVKPEKRITGTVRDKETKYLPWVTAGVSLILLITTLVRLGF